jgi:hypothetical protein
MPLKRARRRPGSDLWRLSVTVLLPPGSSSDPGNVEPRRLWLAPNLHTRADMNAGRLHHEVVGLEIRQSRDAPSRRSRGAIAGRRGVPLWQELGYEVGADDAAPRVLARARDSCRPASGRAVARVSEQVPARALASLLSWTTSGTTATRSGLLLMTFAEVPSGTRRRRRASKPRCVRPKHADAARDAAPVAPPPNELRVPCAPVRRLLRFGVAEAADGDVRLGDGRQSCGVSTEGREVALELPYGCWPRKLMSIRPGSQR